MNSVRKPLVRLIALLLCGAAWGGTAAAQTSPPITRDTTKSSGRKAGKTAPAGDLIDLNSATLAELKTLPGIADAYGAAIIKHRPYVNKRQLKSRNVIPAGSYEKIKDKVIAKQ